MNCIPFLAYDDARAALDWLTKAYGFKTMVLFVFFDDVLLWRAWATPSAAPTCASRARSSASACSASPRTSATRPSNLPDDARRGRDLHRDPREQPRGRRGARARHPGAAPRRRAARRSSPPARTVAVAGSHGKTTTSSMLALILRAAGWHPSFLIGGDLNEVGTNAVFDDGEWLVVEADESDGTFLELARRSRDRHQRRARPPRPLRRLRRARRRVRAVRRRDPGRRASLCADDADRRRASRRAPAGDVVTYGFADDADYRMRDYEGGRGGTQFALRARRRAARRGRAPGARAATTR